MKESTKGRKKAREGFEEALGKREILKQVYGIYSAGKAGFDIFMRELGRMPAETIMYKC